MALPAPDVEADLAALGHAFRIDPQCRETLDAWVGRFNCLPSEFLKGLMADMPGAGEVTFCLDNMGKGRFDIKITQDDNLIARAVRRFDLQSREVEHVIFEVEDNFHGRGIGAIFTRNSFVLYTRLGLTVVKLYANFEAGGYVWACFGFRPTQEEWAQVREEIGHRAAQLPHSVPSATRKALSNSLKNNDPRAIWVISDLDEGGRLGRRLLAGTHWHGFFDFRDADALDKLHRYIGSKLGGGS